MATVSLINNPSSPSETDFKVSEVKDQTVKVSEVKDQTFEKYKGVETWVLLNYHKAYFGKPNLVSLSLVKNNSNPNEKEITWLFNCKICYKFQENMETCDSCLTHILRTTKKTILQQSRKKKEMGSRSC